jgi:membrane protein required for colicin V production
MLIDLIYVVLIIVAALHGYRSGLIVGLFSLVAIIIGVAAAMKLSSVLAAYLGERINISKEWLPIISFAIILLVVLLLIRLVAKFIEKVFQSVLLGWVNRLAGIVFFIAIYTLVYSVLIFYAEQMKLLLPATTEHSVLYTFIKPWGPRVIDGLGNIIPVFRDLFAELENFFQGLADKAAG